MAEPTSVGSIGLDLEVNKRMFNRQLKDISRKSTPKVSSAFSKLGVVIASAFAVTQVVRFGKACVNLASDLQEVQNVVDVVFGESSKDVNNFAKNALRSFGLSELSAKRFTSTMGAMLKSSGLTVDQTKGMSLALTGLAGDVASFYNLNPEEAFNKIRSGISGETEPLKRLGINLSVANLESYALAQGIAKSYQEMTQAEKTILRYNYLLSVTGDAQGDFARTSKSWANQVKIMGETWKGVMANIGSVAIMVFTPILRGLNWIIQKLYTATQYFKAFAETLFGVKEEAGAVGAAIGSSGSAVDGLGDSVKSTSKKVKGALGSFDQLNTLAMSTSEAASEASAGMSSGFSIEPVTYGGIDTSSGEGAIDKIKNKVGMTVGIMKSAWNSFTEVAKPVIMTIYTDAIKPAYDLIKRIVLETLSIMKNAWNTYGKQIIGILKDAWVRLKDTFKMLWTDIIKPILGNTVKRATELWDNHIKGMVTVLFDTVGKIGELIATLSKEVLWPFIQWMIQKFGPPLVATFNWIVDVSSLAFGVIGDSVGGLLKILGGLCDFVTGVLSGDWNKAWSGMGTVVTTIMNGVKNVFKNAINGLIGMVNIMIQAMNKIKVSVPDWVPKIGGKSFGINIKELEYLNTAQLDSRGRRMSPNQIAALATGGVVTQPTLAMIGERNKPEAVIPLTNNQFIDDFAKKVAEMLNSQSGSSSENEGDVVLKIGESEFARMAIRAINGYSRQTGVSLINV